MERNMRASGQKWHRNSSDYILEFHLHSEFGRKHCTECVEENNLSCFFLSENYFKRHPKIALEGIQEQKLNQIKVELSYNKL